MFSLDGNYVLAPILIIFGNPFNGQVDGFRCARCEDQLVSFATQQIGDLLAGLLYGFTGANAKRMGASGISEVVGQKRHHRIQHPWVQLCGGVIVEVNHTVKIAHSLTILLQR